VSKEFLKEIAFPFWRAMDKRWNKYVVSLVFSVTMVTHLPVSLNSSIAMMCNVLAMG